MVNESASNKTKWPQIQKECCSLHVQYHKASDCISAIEKIKLPNIQSIQWSYK